MVIAKTTSRGPVTLRESLTAGRGWREYTRQLIHQGSLNEGAGGNVESATELEDGHRVIYALPNCPEGTPCRVGFSSTGGSAVLSASSLLIPGCSLSRLSIPNGATHVHFEGTISGQGGNDFYVHFASG